MAVALAASTVGAMTVVVKVGDAGTADAVGVFVGGTVVFVTVGDTGIADAVLVAVAVLTTTVDVRVIVGTTAVFVGVKGAAPPITFPIRVIPALAYT